MRRTLRDQPQFPGEGVLQSPGQVRQAKGVTAGCGSPSNLHSVHVENSMERVKKSECVVKPKKPLKIGTLNVRTISKDGRRSELVYLFEKYGLNMLGVQEHRREHKEDIAYNNLGKSTMFITSSCIRNNQNARVGGVGLLLDKNSYNALSSIEKINERIMVAHFNGNPKCTVIVCYSPTNTLQSKEKVEEFYEALDSVISTIPPHNMCFLIGDLNAKVKGNWSYHSTSNNNGEKLEELKEEHRLWNATTSFQKRRGKIWTYTSPKGEHSQIDHILINKKWKNSIKNAEAYSTFKTVGSDHRIVVAQVRISLRKPKQLPKKVKLDWDVLRTNENLALKYSVEVGNRYNALRDYTDDADTCYEKFIDTNNKVAEELLPKLKKSVTKSQLCNHPAVTRARESLTEAYRDYSSRLTKEMRENIKAAKMNLDEAYDHAKASEIDNQVTAINGDSGFGKMRKVWKLVHDISGRNVAYAGKIDGSSEEERVEAWENHFKGLLGQPPKVTKVLKNLPKKKLACPIDDDDFTIEEYREVVDKIVEGKNGGADGLRPEVLRRGSHDLDHLILGMCNKALREGNTPTQWSEMNIVPVPKSGPLNKVENYRGISMCPVITKVLNKLILFRMRPAIEPILRKNQNGFRPERGTVAHILALRRILEGIRDKKLPATLVFVDFSKAFDSIDRDNMFEILKSYGVPKRMLQLIISIYEKTMARVTSPDGDTLLFKILAGIMQGDTLAPYLFIIVLDYALTQALEGKEELGFTLVPRRSRRHPAKIISDLDYADDIATISNTVQEAQKLIYQLETAAAEVGLHINAKKTQCINYNQTGGGTLNAIDGSVIKEVEDYKYLGAWISSTKKDFSTRRARAWDIAHKLKPLWTSKMPRATKVGVLTAAVESVLMYGSESWTLTDNLTKRLDGLYTRLLRFALNVTWKDKWTNKRLYDGLPKLSEKLQERRMKLAGHLVRHPEEAAHDIVLWEPLHGDPKRGAPTMNFVKQLKRDTGLESVAEIKAAMLDRDGWRDRARRTAGPPTG